jgi:hypothetical protein
MHPLPQPKAQSRHGSGADRAGNGARFEKFAELEHHNQTPGDAIFTDLDDSGMRDFLSSRG